MRTRRLAIPAALRDLVRLISRCPGSREGLALRRSLLRLSTNELSHRERGRTTRCDAVILIPGASPRVNKSVSKASTYMGLLACCPSRSLQSRRTQDSRTSADKVRLTPFSWG